ncbi:MAG: peptidoglycan DD-metalloendopeptidase family protein [Ginsengibacter sp.]
MYQGNNEFCELVNKHRKEIKRIIDFDSASEKIVAIDLSDNNPAVIDIDFENTEQLSLLMKQLRESAGAKYGIGGYDELRSVYSRSKLFNSNINSTDGSQEPRRLHLGTDIWGEEGTTVYAPLDGIIHSFAFNDNFGDYGATLILEHVLYGIKFHTLYGHLSLKDITGLQKNKEIKAGELIAHFGSENENGNWPPHLHFQLIKDMDNFEGDYPGVCKLSEREKFLQNCPDPDCVLELNKFTSR